MVILEIHSNLKGIRKIGKLLEVVDGGLYCPAGDFWIDPLRPVKRAVVTHGHSDHARSGSDSYLTPEPGLEILKIRLGSKSQIQGLSYGEKLRVERVQIQFFPSGHILGAGQVRIEGLGEVCVVTGDQNATHAHPACAAFESVACDVFVTECTFGLPIYRWPDPETVLEDIAQWVSKAAEKGRTCLLSTYPLGKTQRLLEGLARRDVNPVGVVGAATSFLPIYEAAGISMGKVLFPNAQNFEAFRKGGLIIASMSGDEPAWFSKLGEMETASASGWMQTRGARRGFELDRGFVLSDHADWQGLLNSVTRSGAGTIGVMHGDESAFGRYLSEVMGLDVSGIRSGFGSGFGGEEESETSV